MVLRQVAWFNTLVLRLGRHLTWVILAMMVIVILIQICFRYLLNDALAWPDEAARFLMLWMVGLSAPSAMRWGGFVSIDTLATLLPDLVRQLLTLAILILCFIVLVAACGYGFDHTFGFGGQFNSSSLKIPLEWLGVETIRVKLRYMYASLLLGVLLLASVTFELILRTMMELLYPNIAQPEVDLMPEKLGRSE